MDRRQTSGVLILFGSVFLLSVVGCSSSTPQLDDAQDAFEDDEYETALTEIEGALDRDSANTDAYLLKARILRQMADTSMEAEEYHALHRRAHEAEEEALRFDPALGGQVDTTRREVYDREVRQGEEAYNYGSKNDDPEALGLAVTYLGAAAAVLPDSARPLLHEAHARLRLGQRQEAIPVLERYVERVDTGRVDAYKILGQLYLDSGDHDAAVDILERASRLFSADQEVHALRMNAYNRTGTMDRAMEVYRAQIEAQPDVAGYRYNYGTLLLEAGRYEAAITHLRRAVEIQPHVVEHQYNLGAAYLNAALALDDSLATRERDAMTGDPTEADALAERRTELFEKAVPPLERARQMQGVEEGLQRDACRALLVAYIQTERLNRAGQVEDCTGLREPGR